MRNAFKQGGATLALLVLLSVALAACVAPAAPVQQPAQSAPEEARTVNMYVGPKLVDCQGVGPQKCYQVKAQPEDEYRLFYSPIQGFQYEPGYDYQITVRVEPVDNPPADASAYSYTLVDVVSKTPAAEAVVEIPVTATPVVELAVETPETGPAAALEGTPWKLVSYVDAKGQMLKSVPGTEITAEFRDGRVSGNTGCNSYFGDYQVAGEELSIRITGSTMKACPEPVMSQEMTYLAALDKAGSYQIKDDELQIAGADGTPLLTYVVLQPSTLSETKWQVTAYNNGKQALVSPLAGSEITLLFGADGIVSGSTGCNNYTASYTVEGDKLTVGPAAVTRMMCAEPEGIMEQEAAYLAALSNVASYTVRGDALTLADAAGTKMVEAQASKAETSKAEAAPDEWTTVLKDLEYQSQFTQSGVAPLKDGEYREPAAPGSASETVVVLTDYVATGDLNGDGTTDAAAVLATNSGGSGVFMDLAAVVMEDGKPVNVAIAPLGDRVQVKSLTIQDGEILVDMITHGPDDPMCCPTQHVVETYVLQGDELVLTSSAGAAPEGVAAPDLVGTPWQWLGTIYMNDTELSVPNPEKYTIQFMPDGSVAVRADCNRGTGTYLAEGSSLSIEIQTMTMAACPPESLSDQYIQELGDAATYVMQEGSLIINLKVDGGNMQFEPAVSTE